MKHVDKYNKKLSNYEGLVEKSKSVLNCNISDYKIWCNIRQKKIDGTLPSPPKDLRTFAEKLENREPLSLK